MQQIYNNPLAMQKSYWKQLGPETRHTAVDLHSDSATQANLCIGSLVDQTQAEDGYGQFGKQDPTVLEPVIGISNRSVTSEIFPRGMREEIHLISMRKQSDHIIYTSYRINDEYTIHNTVRGNHFLFYMKSLNSGKII